MRAALYFTPLPQAALSRDAARWLGRSPYDAGRSPYDAPPHTTSDPLTASPARYGFHATLKAPFRLAGGTSLADLDAALKASCAAGAPVTIPHLRLATLGAFFALVPDARLPALDDLERAVVTGFDAFRAPLTPDEIARRDPDRLTQSQRDKLARWGYPYVLGDFRFHMTLTGPVPEAEHPAMASILESHFAIHLGRPLTIDGLALFVEDAPGASFRVHTRHALARIPAAAGAP